MILIQSNLMGNGNLNLLLVLSVPDERCPEKDEDVRKTY